MWLDASRIIFLLTCLSLVEYVVSVNGQWGPWSLWSTCTQTCGYIGYTYRERYCNNPTPSNGGLQCPGDTNRDNLEQQTNTCPQYPCPVNGNWGQWKAWSGCTQTCGWVGTRNRYRYCNNPAPLYGGKNCPGSNYEIDNSCANKNCPVNGKWSAWSSTGVCSTTCGGGTMAHTRQCNNPTPSHGGLNCSGIDTGYRRCGENNCPVDGHWNVWSTWSSCTVTCDGGNRTKERNCTNPPPEYGGKNCYGSELEYDDCSIQHCPVDGFWGSWLSWNNCQSTCGNGTKSRKRQCDRPPPNNGGKNCLGNDTDEAVCLDQYCSDSLTSDGNSLGVIIGGIITAVVVVLVVVKVFLLPKINSFTAGLRKRSSTNVHIVQTGINVSTTVDNNQDDAYLKLERVTGMRSVGNDYDELQVHNEVTGDPDNAYCDIALDDSSEYDKR